MKKRNLLKVLFLVVIILYFGNNANAITAAADKAANVSVSVDVKDISTEEAEFIKKFSFRNKFQRSPEAQIKSFYKDYNKYSEKNDIEKLKSLYSDSYVNNDGFNKETIFKMMSMASDSYKEVEYITDIEKISVEGNYAVVDVHEVAIGSTAKKQEDLNDYGLVTSDLYYTDNLVKEGNKWKIAATVVKSEKVALKYGEAKNMPIEITAPKMISAGADYDVRVKTQSPDGVLVIGSIINEQIVFPQIQNKDKFKSVKSDVIERILKANEDSHNEYAAVTIGITRASIEPPAVVFNMTGMAFVMTRVNVLPVNNNVKIEKEVEDVKASI